jgi:acyl-CoA hydrolase
MYAEERLLAVTGLFTFVAVDDARRPVAIHPVSALVDHAEERRD